jgi:glycosyltransferase involved in cell wall biosynthesis
MAAALPVLISRRCGCAYDLVQEGRNGFTFDPSSVEDIAQTLMKMGRMEPAVRAEFGQASRRLIDGWGPDRFAAGLCDAIRAVEARRPEKRLSMAR